MNPIPNLNNLPAAGVLPSSTNASTQPESGSEAPVSAIGQVSQGADGKKRVVAAGGHQVAATSTVDDETTTDAAGIAAAQKSIAGGAVTQTGPDLPDAQGEKAGPKQILATVSGLMGGGDGGHSESSSISFAEMYSILQRVMASSQILSSTLQRASGNNVVAADQAIVADTMSKIKADQKAATVNLVSTIVGVTGAAGLSFYGTALQAKGTSAKGAMMNAVAQPFSQVIQTGTSAWNINAGSELDSRQADVAVKVDEVQKQLAQNVRDSAKGTYDQATEFIRSINQFVLTCIQNWKGANDSTANR